jgi:hypothetical protein
MRALTVRPMPFTAVPPRLGLLKFSQIRSAGLQERMRYETAQLQICLVISGKLEDDVINDVLRDNEENNISHYFSLAGGLSTLCVMYLTFNKVTRQKSEN